MNAYFIAQWKSSAGRWSESEEQQGGTDIQTAREFKERLIGAGYEARIVSRTDIVVE